jgi:hypothetical protein
VVEVARSGDKERTIVIDSSVLAAKSA